MKHLRQLSFAVLLTLVLTFSALAGDQHGPDRTGQVETPAIAGEIGCPGITGVILTPGLVTLLLSLI